MHIHLTICNNLIYLLLFLGAFSEELLRKEIKRVMESSSLEYNDKMDLNIISFLRNNSYVINKN